MGWGQGEQDAALGRGTGAQGGTGGTWETGATGATGETGETGEMGTALTAVLPRGTVPSRVLLEGVGRNRLPAGRDPSFSQGRKASLKQT